METGSEIVPKKTPRHPYRHRQELIDAIRKNHGVLTHAADDLGMTLAGLWSRVHKGPDKKKLKEVVKKAKRLKREKDLDLAEKQHIRKIKEGDSRHIIYHLETQGRERGYGKGVSEEKTDQNLNWEIKIVHQVDENDNIIDCTPTKLIKDAEHTDTTEV